jgi:epothilone polyketide synthase D
VAKWLAKKGVTDLVLTSRSGKTYSEVNKTLLADLKETGVNVTIASADVSNYASIKAVIDAVQASGAPLGGIVHSAGVLDDKKLSEMDWASFEKVMGSKVDGAANLHDLTKDISTVEQFILFSSATAVMGNIGQANYAAANFYLDALAHSRALEGLPALSVNWGPWAEVGMAADVSLAKALASIGVEMIPVDSGLSALETAITTGAPQFPVLRISWAKYLPQFGASPPSLLAALVEETEKRNAKKNAKKDVGAAAQAVIKKLEAVPSAKRATVLSGMIQTKVMEILGITDSTVVDTTSAISDFGLDSMMSVELRNELQDLVGMELSGTLLFDYPTIESLTTYLLDEVLEIEDANATAAGPEKGLDFGKLNDEPIAIVGMACRMPGGGNTPDQFWANLSSGKDCTQPVPADRWIMEPYFYDPNDLHAPGKSFINNGGFLEFEWGTMPDRFDAQFFGISKREAEFMDPAQRMLLEVTWEAFEAAGIAPDTLVGSRAGVYTGLCASDYQLLETKSGDLSSYTGLYGTGNSHAVAAGRISYTFGLKGPAFSVDTACSSALLATHLGCMDLRNGITNMAVAGGVHLLLAPDLYVNFAKAKMLSPNGRCATFDAEGDGFCRAEGSCMVICKRLSDAIRDGDNIQVLIRGSATNQDGRSNSLTAPNGPSQQAVISEALQMGGVDPHDVSYMECHGTGTSLGDPIEVGAISSMYGKGRSADKKLVLGSVKASIGHLEATAGMSGLCKIMMCMANETIPPQIHFNSLNPMINIDGWGTIPTECMPWKGYGDNKLIAGVSSFGFGGSNAHMVVEKYRPSEQSTNDMDRHLHVFPLSAQSTNALTQLAEKYVDFLGSTDETLENICFTAGAGRQHFPYRMSVACSSLSGLSDSLKRSLADQKAPSVMKGRDEGKNKVVFLFTGQGAQYADMGKELYETSKTFRSVLDDCMAKLNVHMDVDIKTVIFPTDDKKTMVDETAYTQPCMFAIEYALAMLWQSWGVEPAAVVGHSVGEYVAACIAGALNLDDACKLIVARARLMNSMPKEGKMVAVFAPEDKVRAAMGGVKDVDIAAVNGPLLVVVSGKSASVDSLIAKLAGGGVKSKPLNTSHAFHSSLMEPMLADFKKIAETVEYNEPFITMATNVSGKILGNGETLSADYFCDHIRGTVRFSDCVQAAFDAGNHVFLEVGPNAVLSGMAGRVLPDAVMVPSLRSGLGNWATMSKAVSGLYTNGVAFSWKGFEQDFTRKKVLLPFYAFQRQRYWRENCNIEHEGYVARRLIGDVQQTAAGAIDQGDAILYDTEWATIAAAEAKTASFRSACVLADASGIGQAVAKELRSQGVTVDVVERAAVNWLDTESVKKALTDTEFVIDCLSADLVVRDGLTAELVRTETEFACGHLLALGNALTSKSKLVVVTSGAADVDEKEAVNYLQSPASAFARSLSLEKPDVWHGMVDVDAAATPAESAAHISVELRRSDNEDQVAYRKGARFALRVVPAADALPSANMAFAAEDVFVVTGGFGGVLQEVIRWMVSNGAKKFVVTTRRQKPEHDKFIAEIEKAGASIDVAAIDVCDFDAVQQMFAGLKGVAGIIHGAGAMTATPISDLGQEEMAKVLRPKTEGAWNLHVAAEKNSLELKFFILFSSISAVWGSNNLSHYGAANAFLDGIASYRQSKGQVATSVQWGLLESGGMTSAESEKFSRAMGLSPLPVANICATLNGSMSQPGRARKLAVAVEWAKFKALYEMKGAKPLLEKVGAAGASGSASAAGASRPFSKELLTKLSEVDADARPALVLEWVVGVANDCLGFEGDLETRRGLFEIGFDSLGVQEFKQALESDIGVELSNTLAFDYPNLQAIATHMVDDVLVDALGKFSDASSVAAVTVAAPAAVVPKAVTSAVRSALTNEPIAVIGIGTRFPGDCSSPEAFWSMLQEGRDCISVGPVGRWNVDDYFDADQDAAGKTYSKWGGFVNDVNMFDPKFFNMSVREAQSMDPQQRLLMETSWEALEDAGIRPADIHGTKAGVFIGIGTVDYSRLMGVPGHFEEMDAYFGTGNSHSVASGRLSFYLGVQGPSVAIDTACSSTLVSTHLACQSLRLGECNLALAGGVNLMLAPEIMVNLCKAHMLSPTGRCHTFDSSADGYVRGEGAGIIVLKPLSNAVEDNDLVYATIRGSAINHDGASSGLTVPNGPSQQSVIRQALASAQVQPEEVSYIEAHGTGTSLGDPIEINSLNSVFKGRTQPLHVGTVKTNVGHLESAAGIVGLIKTILSVKHGQIPSNNNFDTINPLISFKPANIVVPSGLTKWPSGFKSRIAGVSSFGFSGTNAHIVLEEAPKAAQTFAAKAKDWNMFVLSANSEDALRAYAGKVAATIQANAGSKLSDLCYTAFHRRTTFPVKLAIPVNSKDALAKELRQFSEKKRPTLLQSGMVLKNNKVAFLFTGQGSQYPGMGEKLYKTEVVFQAAIDACDAVLKPLLGKSLTELLFNPKADESGINETKFTQPALFAFEYAMAQLWMSWGVKPAYVVGHSVGEYVAACVAGVFSMEDGCKLIVARAQLMGNLPKGGVMVAVFTDQARVEKAIAPFTATVAIGASNGPQLTVVSGDKDNVDKVLAELAGEGIKSKALVVSHAFHSPMMEPILPMFEMMAGMISFKTPTLPIVSNVTGQLVTGDEMSSAAYWKNHIRSPVLFLQQMRTLAKEGCDIFVEVGPQPVLLGMGRRCLPDDSGAWVPSLQQGQDDIKSMLKGVSALYANNVKIDLSKTPCGEIEGNLVRFPTVPFDRRECWIKTDRDVYGAPTSFGSSSVVTPLLGNQIVSPRNDVTYETSFDVINLPLLADHVLHDVVVVPGAAYISMALSAGVHFHKTTPVRLSYVTFPQALVLPDAEKGRKVQLIIDSQETDAASNYALYSYKENNILQDEWVCHMTGQMEVMPGDIQDAVMPAGYLEEVKARCNKTHMTQLHEKGWSEEVYKILWDREYHLRTAFRWLGSIWAGETEAICEMRMPLGNHELDGFELFPGLIDSCFQLLSSVSFDRYKGTTFIPMGCDQYNYFGKPTRGSQLYCHATERPMNEYGTTEALGADIFLFDSTGKKIVELVNLRLKRAGAKALIESAMKEELNNQFYKTLWKPVAAESKKVPASDFVFVGDAAVAMVSETVSKLTAAGHTVEVVNEHSADALTAFFANRQAEKEVRVVHMLSLDMASEDPTSTASYQNSVASAHNLVGALKAANQTATLFFVTSGVADRDDAPQAGFVAASAVWGYARVVALEFPQFNTALVDVPLAAGAEHLAAELCKAETTERQVYLSAAGERLGAKLVKAELDPVERPVVLKTSGRGVLDNLYWADADRPRPTAGQVEVRIKVSGMNFRDVMNAMNMFPKEVMEKYENNDMPFGGEASGVITEVGPNVTNFAVGDEVFGIVPRGFATYAVTNSQFLVKKPVELTFEQAVTIPATFLTAYYSLVHLARVKKGETVLVHAASGGVGLAAVQICKALGCEIFGTAGREGKKEYLRNLGVDHVLHSRDTTYAEGIATLTKGEGVDVVLNSLSGDNFIEATLKSCKKSARFIEIGKAGIWSAERVAASRSDVDYKVWDLTELWDEQPELIQSMMQELTAKVTSNEIAALPLKVFPEHAYVDMFRYMANAKHIGKIALSRSPPLKNVTFSDSGTYLVTGGLGGVGLLTSQWLIENGAKNLAILSRSGATESNADLRAGLEAAGATVKCFKVDMADAGAVAKVVQELGQNLKGVIHSAGVTADKMIDDLTDADFQRTYGAKVHGAWNLHQALLAENVVVDFFVMYSSVSGVIGNAGQSNYAAANLFLDGLATLRQNMGLAALSVNWGPWGEVGMASRMDPAMIKMMGGRDAMIMPAEGMQLLKQAMMHHLSAVAVVSAKFLSVANPNNSLMTEIATDLKNAAKKTKALAQGAPISSGDGPAPLEELLLDIPESGRKARLVEFISEEVARILALDSAADIDPKKPLSEMGLDSLMAVELRNSLAEAAGQPLSATLLFDYPMVIAVADYLLDNVLKLDGVVAIPAPAPVVKTVTRTLSAPDMQQMAIIGMSCRMPGGGNSPEEFWENLSAMKDCVDVIPNSRWDMNKYFSTDKNAPGKMYSKWAGLITEDIQMFDPFVFGISPHEAHRIDPQQRLLLEVSLETLERSGHWFDASVGTPVGVFVGICSNDYQLMQTKTGDASLVDAYFGTGNANSVASGRIAYTFGLQGPTISIDTACSSSLVGVHLAIQSLRTGECTMALAGGVNALLEPTLSINFSKANMLSADGHCHTFDASANGYVRGEGCGMVMLRPLKDALEAGDNVVAVIRGSAINQDGKTNGVTAPNGPSQQKVIRAALNDANVNAADVSYIQAHGTGTPLGDPIEVDSLAAVLNEGRASNDKYMLGSVKTKIGHLEGAAGVSGLFELILAVQNSTIPGHLGFNKENPHLSLERAGAIIPTKTMPWPDNGKPRIGGVSSFGFSGTNAHVVVSEAPPAHPRKESELGELPSHLFTLSARTAINLKEYAKKYMNFLPSGQALGDVCFTSNTGRNHHRVRIAVNAKSEEELRASLEKFVNDETDKKVVFNEWEDQAPPKTAFLFTGQGSQKQGMCKELYDTVPIFRSVIDDCIQTLNGLWDVDAMSVLFGGAADDEKVINKTQYAQPLLFITEYALAKMWMSWGVVPDAVMGHSVGEIVAACIAGVFSLEDGLKLITTRARLMGSLPEGGSMAAVFTGIANVQKELESIDGVVVAANNGPTNVVVSGSSDKVEALLKTLTAKGVKSKALVVSHAFHSHLMEPILDEFEQTIASISFSAPRIAIISNMTGKHATSKQLCTAKYWRDHIRSTVQFDPSITTLVKDNFRCFVECGPSPVAIGMAQRIVPDARSMVWASSANVQRDGSSDWQLCVAGLSELYCNGVEVDFVAVEDGRDRRRLALPSYPFQKQRYWVQGLEGAGRVEDDSVQGEALTKFIGAPVSKIVGQRLSTPFTSETVFISHFSCETTPVLDDHVINGFLIVPAVFDVGMVLEAAAAMYGNGTKMLENIMIPSALVLNDIRSRPTQLVMTPDGDDKLGFNLLSYKGGPEGEEESWLQNCFGKLRIDNVNQEMSRVHETPLVIQSRTEDYQDLKAFYTFMYANEYELGPGFQLVDHIWNSDVEAMCRLVIQPASITNEFQLYPVYFDCCIQVIASIVGRQLNDGDESVSFVPMAIEKFILYQTRTPSSVQLYCHTMLDGPIDLEKETINAQMAIIDDDGNVIAEAINFRVKKAGKELLMKSLQDDLTDWFYQYDFVEKTIEDPVEELSEKSSWLVFATSAVGSSVRDLLRANDQSVVTVVHGDAFKLDSDKLEITIRPDQKEDYDALLSSSVWDNMPECAGVVHMWAAEGEIGDVSSEQIVKAESTGVHSVLNLTQALMGWSAKPKLWVVTRLAQATGVEKEGALALGLAQAPTWGLAKVVALEVPQLQCVRLDLGAEAGDAKVEAQAIFTELCQESKDIREVAFRDESRLVSQLVRKGKTNSGLFKIVADKTYVITGGLGGLGLTVAAWLVKNGARNLILLSRRSAPASGPVADKIKELQDVGATVNVGQADVANKAQLEKVFQDIAATDFPVGGVVHSAGVIDDKMVPDLDWQSFEKVMAAKVHGTNNLHLLTKDLASVDFLVLFSSNTSVVGNIGQANYAAANVFLDAMAQHRRAQGLPCVSINWGPWSEVGMAAGMGEVAFESMGLGLVDPKHGMQVLRDCMNQDTLSQIVVAPVMWPKFLSRFGKNIPSLYSTLAEKELNKKAPTKKKKKAAGGNSDAAAALTKKLTSVPAAKRLPVLANVIQGKVMEVLGVEDASVVSQTGPLSELGLDSLMATELKNVLEDLVGQSLPGTLLFDYPTIEALSKFIMDECMDISDEDDSGGGGGGGLSQDQLDAMRGEPIAIVGMSLRMPAGGNTAQLFWENLCSAKDCVSTVPLDRWDHSALYDKDADVPGKAFTNRGGFLADMDVYGFDATFFGISPKEAEHMDPQQRMLLEVAWETFENAGIPTESMVGSRTGVFLGICGYDATLMGTRTNDLGGIVGYTGTGVAWSVAAGRISYTLGLKGPAFTVDTACSSALLATHLGVVSLRTGETNAVLAGGVNLLLAPDLYVNFSKAKMLSPNGRCATFDAAGDGFCRGEGSAVVLLKRLSDAERDGDNIHALIRGSASNQDGRSNSLTAPNGPSQQAVIREALAAGGIEPHQVTYLECHGTGTSLGDPIEVMAAKAVLSEGRAAERPVIVGSVKASIGHLEGAAGLSGLVKILQCFKHEMVPPQIHFKELNPMITIEPSMVIPLGQPIPMDATKHSSFEDNERLIASVSSFGFGGSNAHAVLEKYRMPAVDTSVTDRPLHVLPLSAKSEAALVELATKYVQYFDGTYNGAPARTQDVCYTAGIGRSHFDHRIAITTENNGELKNSIMNFIKGSTDANIVRGKKTQGGVAMLFTGQGSQAANMGKDLYDISPQFKKSIDDCAGFLNPLLKKPLLSVLFASDADKDLINETEFTQPCLFAFEYALAQLWQWWGVEPTVVLGHSVGEYVAACVAGNMSLEDTCTLIAARGRLMGSLPKGGKMVAVFASEAKVQALIDGTEVAIAAVNGPTSVVISGNSAGVDSVLKALTAENFKCKELNTSHAFHSSMMEPVLEEFKAVASKIEYQEPFTTMVLNRTGKVSTAQSFPNADYWVDHLRNAVRFADSVDTVYDMGVKMFLEVGASPVLSGMARRSLAVTRDDDSKWFTSLSTKQPDWLSMTRCVSSLYSNGVTVDWKNFDTVAPRQKVHLPTYAWQYVHYESERNYVGKAMIAGGASSGSGGSGIFKLSSCPLLTGELLTPMEAGSTMYVSDLSPSSSPLLSDHVVFGNIITPFVFDLCMILESFLDCTAGASTSSQLVMKDISVLRPVIFDGDEKCTSRIEGNVASDGMAFTIKVRSDNEVEWSHRASCSAIAFIEDVAVPDTLNVVAEAEACAAALDTEEFYAKFKEAGIAFGPRFRLLEDIRTSAADNTAFSKLSLPDESVMKGYALYPVLIDNLIQLAAAILENDGAADGLFLPIGMEAVTVYDLSKMAQTRTIFGKTTLVKSEGVSFMFDALLVDSAGEPILKVSGLRLMKANPSMLVKDKSGGEVAAAAESPLYDVEWVESSSEAATLSSDSTAFFVTDDASTAAATDKLEHCKSILAKDWSSVGAVVDAVGKGGFKHVVFVAGSQEESGTISSESILYGILESVKQFIAYKMSAKLWIVTRGAHTVSAGGPRSIVPWQSALWGLGKVVAIEYPALQCTMVDLDTSCEITAQLAALVSEIAGNKDENHVAFRFGSDKACTRSVCRLESASWSSTSDDMMRLISTQKGVLSNLKFVPTENKAPKEGEVEIRVLATGLNFRDVMDALGMYPGKNEFFGLEGAGVVSRVGAGVPFKVGDAVFGLAPDTFSSYAISEHRLLALKPSNISFEEAATLPVTYLTAYHALFNVAKLQATDTVLIHASSGGVGAAAVQLAKKMGCKVIGTASTDEKKQFCMTWVAITFSTRATLRMPPTSCR